MNPFNAKHVFQQVGTMSWGHRLQLSWYARGGGRLAGHPLTSC
jgi:hypothetical protein